MANFKYFADTNGQTVELTGIHWQGRKQFGQPVDFVPTYNHAEKRWNRNYVPVSRSIEYKSNPSKHICDARCINATGKIMRCECSCGGKNHGTGAFTAEVV